MSIYMNPWVSVTGVYNNYKSDIGILWLTSFAIAPVDFVHKFYASMQYLYKKCTFHDKDI